MNPKGAGPIMDATTLAEMLVVRGESDPSTRWLTFLDHSGKEHYLSYGELLERSLRVFSALKQLGVRKSQPILILLPTSPDFLFSFFGTLLVEAVPVPLYPPVRMNELEQYASHLQAVIKDCGARCIITSEPLLHFLRWMARSASHDLSLWTTQELLASGSQGHAEFPTGTSQDTALIQYTSGSTGIPKGVELTHGQLLSNIRSVAKVLNYREGDVGVSWLPLYHDMGLIGAILSTVHFSIPLVLLSPLDFIKSPKRWLWAIHRYRGTLSAAPNFAYSLCVRKLKDHELEGLDLSSWRVAINGAESIHPKTLEEFSERFRPYGFSRKAFVAAYGLAECTLAVTFSALDEEPRIRSYDRKILELEGRAVPVPTSNDSSTVRWVSVGLSVPSHRVRIVDQPGLELPERVVGQIAVQGPSVMKGYYQKPATTAEVLKEGWLYTGDLGFLDQGELYITGRSKDVIIKGGKNYYPQDIEVSASSVDGVRPGCVSAFGVPNPIHGTEEMVLVAETRIRSAQRRKWLMGEIIRKVHRDTGCSPDRVVLVPPGSVSKTSSGKIQRSLCRQRYLNGDLRRTKGWVLWQLIRLYFRSFTLVFHRNR
jgi:acyl-CoA synthetase (AMP-forming)/AMP-acid ligase II